MEPTEDTGVSKPQRDTKTQRRTIVFLGVSVSQWLILSVFSAASVSERVSR